MTMLPPLSLEPNGIVHNRYRIVRIIGQGGMGAVYEAIDGRLGNTVALKQMIVSGQQFSVAFEREARLLAGLRHPSLPKVMDFFTDGAGQFLVMEFIPGADLAALRKQRSQPFAVGEVLRWGDEILQALEFLHGQRPPIIHRDIKPQNLKVTPEGMIVLLDFGLAKGSAAAFSQVATTNSIFGYTPMYAPLEQIQGTGTTPLSDIYSLSATLYHLLTDGPPVDVLARAAALVGGKEDPLQPANLINREVSPAIGAWLQRGLQLDAGRRYSSATEMRAALREIQQRATPTPVPPTVAVSPGQMPTVMPATPQPYQQPISQPYQQQISQQYQQQIPQQYNQPQTVPPKRGSALPWVVAAIAGVALIALIGLVALLLLRQPATTQAVVAAATVARPEATRRAAQGATADNATATAAPTAEPTATVAPTAAPAEPTRPPPPPPPPGGPGGPPPPPGPGGPPPGGPGRPPPPQFGPVAIQRPIGASASGYAPSGQDSTGSQITYVPQNAIDGAEDTAWRVAGAGVNHYLQIDFAGPVRVREVLVLPGYAKTDPFDGTDRFQQNRRVSRARLEFSDGSSVEAEFVDVRQMQLVPINGVLTTFVRIVILETTAPGAQDGRDFTPISEVVVRGEALQR